MKTTRNIHSTANPRRTTLMHLEDAETLQAQAVEFSPVEAVVIPQVTANPRRTVLMNAPAS